MKPFGAELFVSRSDKRSKSNRRKVVVVKRPSSTNGLSSPRYSALFAVVGLLLAAVLAFLQPSFWTKVLLLTAIWWLLGIAVFEVFPKIQRRLSKIVVNALLLPISLALSYFPILNWSSSMAPRFTGNIDCIYVGTLDSPSGSQGVFMWAHFENNGTADSALKDWTLKINQKDGTPILATLVPVHAPIGFIDLQNAQDHNEPLIWGEDTQIGDRQYNKNILHGSGVGGALRFDLGNVPFERIDLASMRLQFEDVETGSTWSTPPFRGRPCTAADHFPDEPLPGDKQEQRDNAAPIMLMPSEQDFENAARLESAK